MTSYSCSDCGTSFTRKFNLERHQASRCLAARRNLANGSCSSAVDAGNEYDQIRPRYSQFESPSTERRKVIAKSQEQSVQNQQHNKALNPKISALVNAIVNEEDESSEKIQRKDLAENSVDDERQHYPDTLDSTSKVVTDENDDEDGDDENGDEDDDDKDNDNEDDDDEDDDNDQLSNKKPQIIKGSNLSKEIKIVINKFSQLFQESKRGVKQNRGKLIILLDLLKDCETIDDNGYEKLYDAIENICNKY